MRISDPITLLRKYPLASVLLLGAVLLFTYTYLQSGRLSQLRSEYDQLDFKVQIMHGNTVNAVGLEADLESMKSIYADIQSRLMDPNKRAINLRYLYTLEQASTVSLENPEQVEVVPFLIEKPKKKRHGKGKAKSPRDVAEYSLVRFKLASRGNYLNMLNFLYNLRVGEYFVRFKNLSIQTSGNLDYNDVSLQAVIEVLGKRK